MEAQYVPEPDVLIAVVKWLHSSGWQLERVSTRNKSKVETELAAVGISINNIDFRREGEDIRARQGDNLWRIECKGLSSGKPETVKNNFDRAVASTVSYYTQRDGLRLGLALPEAYEYDKFLRSKLPQALRTAINLWILLYVSADDEVIVFAPDEEIPT